MSYHACVWIDQKQAKVFEITTAEAEEVKLHDTRPVHHLHRKADHVGLGTVEMDHAMLEAVGKALGKAKAILIVGPGKAKTVLAGYLNEHFPEVAKKVWDIKPSDHPTDAQVIAAARDYFHKADRMH